MHRSLQIIELLLHFISQMRPSERKNENGSSTILFSKFDFNKLYPFSTSTGTMFEVLLDAGRIKNTHITNSRRLLMPSNKRNRRTRESLSTQDGRKTLWFRRFKSDRHDLNFPRLVNHLYGVCNSCCQLHNHALVHNSRAVLVKAVSLLDTARCFLPSL